MALDVSLRLVRVGKHLKVSPAELPRQHIGLRFHECMLLPQKLLANDVGTEARLDHQSRRFLHEALLSLVI